MDEKIIRRIHAASGAVLPELVLKNALVLNVFTNELESADVAIDDGYIVGLGTYSGQEEHDLSGMIICPGFLDGHIHLESSMLTPPEFAKAVIPHGTVGVMTDPHELANVAGRTGIDYLMSASGALPMSIWFMMPSCVPASPFDEAGAFLDAGDIRPYYENPRVLGLAELMDFVGTADARGDIVRKIADATAHSKRIDGHAPGLSGRALNAYITAGVESDHECSALEEGLEKLRRGQWIMIREGTAAHNLSALLPLCREPYANRCMFVTDDKHPGDLLRLGHMDYIIRLAVSLGVDPVTAIKMASFNTARYFGLSRSGAVAPGYHADLVVLDDLSSLIVKRVYTAGKLVAENGEFTGALPPAVSPTPTLLSSMHLSPVTANTFQLKKSGNTIRAIGLVRGELLTTEELVPFVSRPGLAPGVDPENDIVKLAVLERHHSTGHTGIGFLKGYGLKKGAIATSIAHDSHNLIIAGCTDEDMALAANTVATQQGGLAVVADGHVLGTLPLTVGGLISTEPITAVDSALEHLKALAADLGVARDIDAFMTLAFVSLPVIPALRLNGKGLIDVNAWAVTDVFPQ